MSFLDWEVIMESGIWLFGNGEPLNGLYNWLLPFEQIPLTNVPFWPVHSAEKSPLRIAALGNLS